MFDIPKTKDEAMKRKYGSNGFISEKKYNPDFCAYEVASAGRWTRFYQCNKKPGYGPEKLYCKQHDPDEMKRKSDERLRKEREESEAYWITHKRHMASLDLLNACKLCQSMLTIWSVDPDKSPNTILSTLMPVLNKAIEAAEETTKG